MFKIDTGQARTDLYGINKGEAQVIDPSIAMRGQELRAAQEERARAAKAKQEADAQADIETNLSAMGKVDYMPKDRELIVGKQQAYKDYVYKNIDRLRKGDMKAVLEAQNLQSDVMSSAAQSKNFREAWEQRGLELSKNPDLYRPETIQQHLQRASSADAGNWNVDDSIYKKNFDYSAHVLKDLLPVAESTARANKKGLHSNFSLEDANKVIADDLTDPIKFDQAHYDFENAKDKLGAKDPVEYYQKLHAPKLVINSNDTPSEWMVNGPSDKNDINVTHTVDESGGDVHVMNKTTNEDLTVHYNDKGEVTGGTMGTRLTPEEKSANDKVISENIDKDKLYYAQLQKAKAARALLPEHPTQKQMDAVDAAVPNPHSEQYQHATLPFQEKNIKLDKQKTLELAHDKYGIKPHEIIKGQNPNHVDVQKIDNTKKDEGAVWEYGGVSAPESEWIANGWTAEKLKKHAKKK